MLVPEGNDGGLPVSHGGPILEDARYKYVLQLLRDRTEADRAILSIGVVSFIRALMVELGELCHEASLQMIDLDEAEPEPEDTVEIEVDEEDGNGPVQTTMNLVKQDTREEKWHRLVTRLQAEMAGQTKQVRGHHASRLLGLLRSAGPVGEDGEAAQLQALLVAMSEPDVAGGSSGTDGADGWLMQWVHQLGCHLPALQLDHAAVIDDSLDEEGASWWRGRRQRHSLPAVARRRPTQWLSSTT